MTDPKRILEWLEYSDHDWHDAGVLLESQGFFNCIFLCHQAVEKRLKALCVAKEGREPPMTHSLPRLATSLGLGPTHENEQTLHELTIRYGPSRYPGERLPGPDRNLEPVAVRLYERTREVIAWLDSLIQQYVTALDGQ